MQLECRIVITRRGKVFDLGMFDPLNNRYEPLGTHAARDEATVVAGLKRSIEQAGHRLTFCERSVNDDTPAAIRRGMCT